jgi:hypothetical protein
MACSWLTKGLNDFPREFYEFTTPAIDMFENEDGNELIVKIDLPGYEKKDINLSIDEDILHIRAKREHAEKSRSGSIYYKQRPLEIDKTVRLPGDISVCCCISRFSIFFEIISILKTTSDLNDVGYPLLRESNLQKLSLLFCLSALFSEFKKNLVPNFFSIEERGQDVTADGLVCFCLLLETYTDFLYVRLLETEASTKKTLERIRRIESWK